MRRKRGTFRENRDKEKKKKESVCSEKKSVRWGQVWNNNKKKVRKNII